jgi:hypothetical protein
MPTYLEAERKAGPEGRALRCRIQEPEGSCSLQRQQSRSTWIQFDRIELA